MRRTVIVLGLVAVASCAVACGGDDAATTTSDAGDAGASSDATSSDGGAPDGATSDAAIPSACGKPKPGPTNTGVPAGTKLTPSGPIKVTQNGAVIENLDIAGEVQVLANDVVIRKVRITSGDYYPIRYFDNKNTGLVVEDSEIIGTSTDVTAAISFANYTARRLDIHGGADGFKADENVLIEDCWIHDLANAPDQHNDGVQSTGGKGVTIRHNSISGASNACVQTGDEGAATEDLTVECNWLSGGGYSLNIRGTGATRPKNTRIIDNRFARDSAYGPWTIDDPAPIITGNVWDDDGSPIPP
ncbi:MAG: hypothetical protein JWM74_6268 [Myxococcaceae bacterium]|nr:hypothetical protein [Myxococcaceae bacterium]